MRKYLAICLRTPEHIPSFTAEVTVFHALIISTYSHVQDGPIKLAIRGGIDTPLGGQVLISRILEGGAADRYGNYRMQ